LQIKLMASSLPSNNYYKFNYITMNKGTEGDEVEFDLKEGNKGLNAVNVKVI